MVTNSVCVQQILNELEEAIMKIQGARVENNRFCVSVHFRQVRDEVKLNPRSFTSVSFQHHHHLDYQHIKNDITS